MTDQETCQTPGCRCCEGGGMRPISASRAGLLEPTVLAAMAIEPSYGYVLRRRAEELSGGVLSVDPGSMYRLLRRLEDDGAVESAWAEGEFGPQRREYTITDRGRGLLNCWKEFLLDQQRLHEGLIATIDSALKPVGRE